MVSRHEQNKNKNRDHTIYLVFITPMQDTITNLLSNPFFIGFLTGMGTHWFLIKKLLEANHPTTTNHVTNQRP